MRRPVTQLLLLTPDPSVTAFDTTWDGYVSEWTGPAPSSDLSLFANGDALGPKVCPPSAPMTIPPVLLARVTGTGAYGAFSTEIYVPSCYGPMP